MRIRIGLQLISRLGFQTDLFLQGQLDDFTDLDQAFVPRSPFRVISLHHSGLQKLYPRAQHDRLPCSCPALMFRPRSCVVLFPAFQTVQL